MTDMNRLEKLVVALSEAKTNEKREAAKLVELGKARDAQGAIWNQANAGLNAAQQALDEYLRDTTERTAKTNLAAEQESSD